MILSDRAHLQVAAVSHPGMKGKNNEDRYAVTAFYVSPQNPIPSTLALVCDGIGGHRAGEVAAEIAVETISQAVAESDASRPQDILRDAVISASQAIRKQAETDPAQKGMGATCACAWVIADRLYTVSVGDSRTYLIRRNNIQQLNIDHTWIQEAIEYGALTPEQARGHPNAHVIRRYLGSQEPPVPDQRLRLSPTDDDAQAEANQGLRLLPGDLILLCSDGLTDLVEDSEILAALKSSNLQDALESLKDLANERGGHDNITLVSLGVAQQDETQPVALSPEETQQLRTAPKTVTTPTVVTSPKPAPRPRSLPYAWACLGIGVLALIGLMVVGVVGFSLLRPTPTETPAPTLTQTQTVAPAISTPAVTLTFPPTKSPTPLATQVMPAPTQGPSSPRHTPTPWPNTLFPQLLPKLTSTTPAPGSPIPKP